MLILTALNGSHRGELFEFSGDQPVSLGRKIGPIAFRSEKVAEHHADLTFDGERWFVRDCASRTGTLINHQKVTGVTELHSGDLLQLGSYFLAASITDHSVITPPASPPSEPIPATAATLAPPPMHDALADDLARQEAMLQQVLARLTEQQQRHDQLAALLAQANRAAPVDHKPLLDRIAGQLQAQESKHQQLIEAVWKALERPDAAAPLLAQLRDKLAEQDARHAGIVAAVRDAVASKAASSPPLSEALQAGLEAQRNALEETIRRETSKPQPLLDRIVEGQKVQESRHAELLAALRQSAAAPLSSLEPRLDRIAAQIEAQSAQHARLVADLHKSLAAEPSHTESILKQIAAQFQGHERHQAELAAAIKALVDAKPAAAIEPMLRQIAGRLDAQEALHRELLTAARQTAGAEPRLAELSARLQAQESRHAAATAALLDAIAQLPGQSAPLLQQVITGVEAQAARQAEMTAALQAVAASQPAAIEPFLKPIADQLQRQEARHEQILAAIRQTADAPDQSEPLLRQTAAQLESQEVRQGQLLDAIRAASRAGTEQLDPLLAQVRATIEAQAAKLSEQASTTQAAAAAGQAQIDVQLGQIAAEIKSGAARQSQLLEAVQALAAAEAKTGEPDPLLWKVAQQVQAQTSRQEMILKALHKPTPADPILAQVAAQLRHQGGVQEEMAAAVRGAAAGAARSEPLLQQIAHGVAAQQARQEQLAAELRRGIDEASRRDPPALDRLAEKLTAEWTQLREAIQAANANAEPRLEQIMSQIKAQEAQLSMGMESVKASLETGATRSDPQAQNVAARLETLQVQIEQLAALVKTAAQNQENAATRIKLVAGQSDRPPLLVHLDAPGTGRAVRGRWGRLAATAAVAAVVVLSGLGALAWWQGGTETATLRQTVANLQKQLSQQEKLAGALQPASGQTAAPRRLTDPSNPQGAWRWLSITTPGGDASGAAASPLAMDALAGGAGDNVGLSDDPADGTALGRFNGDQASYQVMANPSGQGRGTDPLTPLQKGFRYAFETGWPIVVGGKFDPSTGKLTGGRTIDPALARKLGFTRWEDWYAFDGANERLRLQQASEQYLQDRKLNPIKYLKNNAPALNPDATIDP